MIKRFGSSTSKIGSTDKKWSRTIVYNTLIGHVDAVRILRSTWPSLSNTPDWRRYIFTMAFMLTMAGSGWVL